MPIYDYKCNRCGRVSEILVSVSDDEAVRCAGCSSEDMKRLTSAFLYDKNGYASARHYMLRQNRTL